MPIAVQFQHVVLRRGETACCAVPYNAKMLRIPVNILRCLSVDYFK